MNLIFDNTVSAGNILTFVGFIVAGLGFAFVLRGDVKNLMFRVDGLEKAFAILSSILQTVAVQDERILNQGKRIDDTQRRLDTLENRE